MIVGILAVLVTGAMLLLGGAALALGPLPRSRAGLVMAACGGVLFTLTALVLLLFLAPMILP